jgi:serine/threonine protein phosphatase PrpC
MPGVQLFGVNGKPVSSNLAGQHYGPKRVWLKNKQVPGLAMTRSLGDFVAKSVGVTSEPEIKVFSSIAENDRAMVIASDGIWDRIPNEEMAQVLLPFLDKKDPEGAAMELTRISVERWQKDHGMVDDITLVVVFLNTTQKLAT